MDLFLTLLIIAIVLAVAGLLFYMQKKHVSFSIRVLLALGAGVVYGLLLQFFFAPDSSVIQQSMDWVNILGTGYVRFLQMIVMPLIFISILSAFTRMTLTKNLGKISALILGTLIATTAIAATIGITASSVFQLEAIDIPAGEAELSRGDALEESYAGMEAATLPQQIVELIPANPFLDLTGERPTSAIGVVIFSAFLGVAYLGVRRKQPEAADTFKGIVDALYAIIMRVVTLILRLTPYGVLAIMTRTVATSDLQAISTLGTFVLASYAALIVMFVIHLIILAATGLSPITYVKKAFPVLAFAFTSRTSAGALPMNIQTQKKLGVPEGIANFAGSFGLSIGQNGCAGIYPAMLAIMIAPTVGQNPLEPTFILLLIVVIAISSFGVAGVGGGATFAAILVLSALDFPIALAGLLISIEPLIDMGRTALNVSGSMVSGIFTSKVTGSLDKEVFSDPNEQLDTQDMQG
ncbi:L-cystine transporter [Shouchella clausii]|uniref:L-cystine uptake protein TcyP n=1 Tax=Shouchella rhizosphaerae TaxID=866786 RepID=A0ABZ2CUC8_9BACI|nr:MULTISPECIES: L-cystine transporter [Shouchella]MCM3313701.1 L-cystine transporter [Psychrobacillus sp. MER TA 17]ALA54237.1 L-cystine uptake protein TcyP [Shouchella clausii]KKI86395.1 sodium:dicarboxylate symporter [Shouchella clausii]MBU3233330.1 L-cystine transporter [Shouchella clausii]MBU3266319.1 L-cystine transporter [Shouchella clausii]